MRRPSTAATPRRVRRTFVWALFLPLPFWPTLVGAQLISPGKLSSVHAELEGIRSCTRCHELRKKGISARLCLECHEPLRTRIGEGKGFHASLSDQDCAACHKEHFGEDFALIRLDTATFDHRRTGYALEGRHAEVDCRGCHEAARIADPVVREAKGRHGALDRTYLGLPTGCASCHQADSPHGDQFGGRACTDCHDTGGWKGASGFDHDQAGFRLTGRHRSVACSRCHQSTASGGRTPHVRYRGVKADTCTDCHQDRHRGAMPGRCENCHDTGGWQRVDRSRVEHDFDHTTTGFILTGTHADTPCTACHQAAGPSKEPGIRIRYQRGSRGRPFPRPDVSSGRCTACHQDLHQGEFAKREDGGDCSDCHGQVAWLPATFDVARHDRETRFPLVGPHRVVPCASCHTPSVGPAPDFHLDASTCLDCHQDTAPHGDQFEGRSCDACHTGSSFRIVSFDHDRTRFPLEGAHARASCGACHRPEPDGRGGSVVRYRPLDMECRACHGGRP